LTEPSLNRTEPPTRRTARTPRRRAVAVAALAAAAGSLFAEAAAPTPFVLLDRSLNERTAGLVALDARTLTLSDRRGRLYTVDPREFLALVAGPRPPLVNDEASIAPLERPAVVATPPGFLPDTAPATAAWTLRLTDGQALLGTLGTPADPDTLAFDAERLGPIVVSLERVAGLERTAVDNADNGDNAVMTKANNAAATDDAVRLANGDVARGFVLGFDPDSIEIDTAAGVRTFDASVVAGLSLANPPAPSSAPMVTLRDGTVLAARPAPPAAGSPSPRGCVLLVPDLINENVDTSGVDGPDPLGSASAATVTRTVCVDPIDIRSIELPGRSITPLATLTPMGVRPDATRRRTDPPATQPASDAALAPSVVLPGPMEVSWPLPADASALVFDARLGASLAAESTPPGRWSSAVLRVTVRTAAGEDRITEHALDGDRPTARVAAALPDAGEPGRTLTIELDAGPYGPIEDRLLLVRPILLGGR